VLLPSPCSKIRQQRCVASSNLRCDVCRVRATIAQRVARTIIMGLFMCRNTDQYLHPILLVPLEPDIVNENFVIQGVRAGTEAKPDLVSKRDPVKSPDIQGHGLRIAYIQLG